MEDATDHIERGDRLRADGVRGGGDKPAAIVACSPVAMLMDPPAVKESPR